LINRLIVNEILLESMKKDKEGYLFGLIHNEEGIAHIMDISAAKDKQSKYGRIGCFGNAAAPGEGIFFSPESMKAVVLNNGIESELRVETIRLKTDIFARMKGLLDTDVLKGKKVAITGLGSVGSLAALELGKAGVGEFILIDSDELSVNNVCRHIGDIEDIGRYKTFIVKDKILRRNPLAKVKSVENNILDIEPDKVEEMLSGASLLIAATDSKEANFYLNELSLKLNIPLVWIGLYERASWGHIVYSIPGETPCLACVVPAISEIIETIPKEERVIDYTAVEDISKIKSEPGLGTDVAFVATAGAKIALALLLRDKEYSSFMRFFPSECTMFIAANSHGAIFRDTKALTTSWVKTKTREDCDYCRKERYLEKYDMSQTELSDLVAKLLNEASLLDTEKG